jgi:hypothetical protein
VGSGHGLHPSSGASRRHKSDVTYSCSRPPYLKAALGTAALSIANSRGSYLSAKYRRIAARRGPTKAIVAVEHAILIAIWTMANTGAEYDDPGPDYFTRRDPTRARQRATRPATTTRLPGDPQPDRRTSLRTPRCHKGESSRQTSSR